MMINSTKKNTEDFKTLGLSVLVGLLFLLSPIASEAYYSTEADSESNSYRAGEVKNSTDQDSLDLDIDRENSHSTSLLLSNTSSITNVIHRLDTTVETCSTSFYNGIEIKVDWDGLEVYEGELNVLNATSTEEGALDLTISANSNLVASANEVCVVKLTLTSEQTSFANKNNGFSDKEEIELTITATEDIGSQPTNDIVLNEIYPAVLSTTTVPLEREWVELYNGTGSDIDVNGYAISEISGGTTEVLYEIAATCPSTNTNDYVTPLDSSNTTISSKGYLVLEFCGSSSYLNDGGDTVSLYDGNSTSTATQLDTHAYHATANGKSHQRIPDGGSWVDPIPTPGLPNQATREDLEAENWSEKEIEKVLATLNKEKEDDKQNDSKQNKPDEYPARSEEDEECSDLCKKESSNQPDQDKDTDKNDSPTDGVDEEKDEQTDKSVDEKDTESTGEEKVEDQKEQIDDEQKGNTSDTTDDEELPNEEVENEEEASEKEGSKDTTKGENKVEDSNQKEQNAENKDLVKTGDGYEEEDENEDESAKQTVSESSENQTNQKDPKNKTN